MEKDFENEISIVIPVYQAEEIIDELVSRVKKNVSMISNSFDVILVDDGSTDRSWDKIRGYQDVSNIKGLRLSRNFGQHKAISAGLRFLKNSKWIVVMDCDLQDNPQDIKRLYAKALEGHDIVLAKRTERSDSYFRVIASSVIHKISSFLSGYKTDSTYSHFGIYSHLVISRFNELNEYSRSFSMLVEYLGFEKEVVSIEKHKRLKGKSSYDLLKLLRYSADLIISHSNKPLMISISLGFFFSLMSFLIAIYNIIAYYSGLIGVPGFTTTVFSIWFSSGILMILLGVIGVYIGKIYQEVKGRPFFVVKDQFNIKR